MSMTVPSRYSSRATGRELLLGVRRLDALPEPAKLLVTHLREAPEAA